MYLTNVIHKYRQDKTYDKDVKMQMRLKFVFKHFLWFTKKKCLATLHLQLSEEKLLYSDSLEFINVNGSTQRRIR